jgi:antitoxin component YwqK of YwqJK toxin-antitoxin module
MKKLILILFLLASASCFAQTTIKYFDYSWKETDLKTAAFMGEIEKTDSGFLRHDYFLPSHNMQMKGLYKDSACKVQDGYFTYYYANEKISKIGKYKDDEFEGLWLSYNHTGVLSDSTFYKKGKPVGISKGWYENGVLSNSVVYEKDGTQNLNFWFDNGNEFSKGKRIEDKKVDTWQYFHKNGKIAAIEKYNLDTLKSREYYNEDGVLVKDTTNRDTGAIFKSGTDKWKKFIIKNLETPRGYESKNKKIITVVISFTIDEEGNVVNPWVYTPYIKIFDNAALDLIKKSPKWNPAIDHHRRVKAFFSQPISYALE